MLQQANSIFLITILSLLLAACSGDGDEITDFLEPEELRLESLSLGEGATLAYRGNPVLEFDPSNTGPYDIELSDPEAQQISLTAIYNRPSSPVSLTVVEYMQLDEDDRTRERTLTSGTAITLDLVAGINAFAVRVASVSNVSARLEYRLVINRPNNPNSADLKDITVAGINSTNTNTEVVFDEEFSSDLLTYAVTVSSRLCSVAIRPITDGTLAQVTVNNEIAERGGAVFVALDEDQAKAVDIVVRSSDGSATKTYVLNITRSAADADTIQSDASLRSLSVAEGRPQVGFVCSPGLRDSSQRVSSTIESVSITATPSREGATMVIGNIADVLSDDSLTIEEEGSEVIEAGEAFTGELLSNLELGNNVFGIIVTAPDGETTRSYSITIIRSASNEIFVSTAEELQQALRNAVPNDEIIIASGDYLGLVSETGSETGSGSSDAHFYSAASGILATTDDEQDQFITINTIDADVHLMGASMSANSVLKISGDNWRIRGGTSLLQVSGAQNGIVLDGANNVLIDSVRINDVGERGLVMSNGASNNQFRGGFIDKTGLAPAVRDGVAEVYAEGVVIGAGEGVATGNAVRNSLFGRNIESEIIDIKATSAGSEVQYNVFDLDSAGPETVANRSVVLASAGAEISFNSFDYNFISATVNPLASIVNAAPAAGEVVEVYENIAGLDEQSVPMVIGGGAGQTFAVANFSREEDDVAPTYSGSVDLNFAHPTYQIQSTIDPTKCLAKRDVLISQTATSESATTSLAVMVDCVQGEASQRWITENDGNGYMTIAQASETNVKLQANFVANLWGGITSGAGPKVLRLRTDALPSESGFFQNASYSLRWQIGGHLGEMTFVNRFANDAITENTDIEVEGFTFDAELIGIVGLGFVPRDASVLFRQIRQ